MTGVQLIGKDQVIATFETLNARSWALYQGKQFIVGGIGTDLLDAWLTNFAAAGSTATYMLRAYEAEEIPTSAAGNTDYIACISFKVVDPYEGAGIHGHNYKLMERIGALEKQLQEKDDTADSDGDLNTIIMGWLSDPAKLNQVAGAVRTIFGGSGYTAGLPAPIQTVSGMNVEATDQETNLQKVASAIDMLEKKDKDLVKHLTKLAELAEKEPAIFNAVLAKLDAL